MDKTALPASVSRVGLVLIDGFALMSYAATVEPLRAANLLAERPLYEVSHLPVSGIRAVSSGGVEIPASAEINEQIELDIVIVIAGGDPGRFEDPRILQWLRLMARRGVIVGGVSGGPVVLARAGIMENRRMTVHWEHAPVLDEYFPTLIVERTLYVIDRDRLTCGGGTAPLDLMHALIARQHGSNFARRVSDWFLHTEIRPSGGPQRAGLAERYRITSAPMVNAIELMETHIADPLDLDSIARLTGIGKRQLNRLFKEKLAVSTMSFYRNVRLEKARTLLAQSTLPVTEIALVTGFANSAHFSHAYKVRYGEPPAAFRRKLLNTFGPASSRDGK